MATRPLSQDTLKQDIESMNGLKSIPDYQTSRPEATPEALKEAYQEMLDKQQAAREQQLLAKEAAEAAHEAERAFHKGVQSMKEAVKGQFGIEGREALAIGLKRKSDYKPPTRKPKTPRD